jgi:hypothetical protein
VADECEDAAHPIADYEEVLQHDLDRPPRAACPVEEDAHDGRDGRDQVEAQKNIGKRSSKDRAA